MVVWLVFQLSAVMWDLMVLLSQMVLSPPFCVMMLMIHVVTSPGMIVIMVNMMVRTLYLLVSLPDVLLVVVYDWLHYCEIVAFLCLIALYHVVFLEQLKLYWLAVLLSWTMSQL